MGLDRLEVIYSSQKTGCFIFIKQPVPEYIEKLSAPDKLHFVWCARGLLPLQRAYHLVECYFCAIPKISIFHKKSRAINRLTTRLRRGYLVVDLNEAPFVSS